MIDCFIVAKCCSLLVNIYRTVNLFSIIQWYRLWICTVACLLCYTRYTSRATINAEIEKAGDTGSFSISEMRRRHIKISQVNNGASQPSRQMKGLPSSTSCHYQVVLPSRPKNVVHCRRRTRKTRGIYSPSLSTYSQGGDGQGMRAGTWAEDLPSLKEVHSERLVDTGVVVDRED